MLAKVFEIRDEGTFIAVIAIDMQADNEGQRYLMRRVGYACDGRPNIMLTYASGGNKANNDPYDWQGRTMPVAHDYIIKNWAILEDGAVVDVEFILGETKQPKVSEKYSQEKRGYD